MTVATMVQGYTHVPGNHCGSTAIRNLLAFHGLEMSEEMALGLGAGVGFYYVTLEGSSPSRFTNGRTARLEEQFVELTGAPIRLETFADPGDGWDAARSAVDGGRPAILLTDLYYLDHYGSSAHFPGHAVVLAGYDSEFAYLSDTGFDELQVTRLDGLRKARHASHPAFRLEGHMFSMDPAGEPRDLVAAAPAAVARCAESMIEPELGEFQGLPALRRFAEEVGDWPAQAQDWRWCARFLYQVVERRGTGGGNFRLMYSRFLEEAGYEETILADAAATAWTSLAQAARAASEPEEPRRDLWSAVTARAASVLDAEERLWDALAASPTSRGPQASSRAK